MPSDVLRKLLTAKEAELAARLASARARFDHMGNRGDAAEAAIREFLSAHLPRWFDVGHGEVFDTSGGRSRQLDVVVTTADHPFRQSSAEPGLFIAEATYATGEVKSKLTTKELDDIIAKGMSLKHLEKVHVAGAQVFANTIDRTRWVDGAPPFFAFAFESNIAPQTLVTRLATHAVDLVDAVFVLDSGAAINFGTGDGTFRFRLGDGRDIIGWAWIAGKWTLLELLGWLHSLPRVQHLQSPLLKYLEAPAEELQSVLLPG